MAQSLARDLVPVRTAMMSVAYKEGLLEFAHDLYSLNRDLVILSSGGTATTLRDGLGEPYAKRVIDVADYTGRAESPDDLVKTLEPNVHAALLMDWSNSDHIKYMIQHGVLEIDLHVGGLYPFSDVAKDPEKTPVEVKKKIDIGGPAMLRAAAKNFPRIAVVNNRGQYDQVLAELRDHDGATTFDLRLDLAADVFALTSQYDGDISRYLRSHKDAVREAFLGE